MDAWFITFIVVGIVGLVVTFGAWMSGPGPGVTCLVITALLGGFLLFMASFTVIPTKTVGIETNFGKPGVVLNNGWHWKAPSAKVHKFDASLQSDHYSTDKEDDGDPIRVRLFTGSTADLNITFQWKLEDNANFVQVYTAYKEPEKIKVNLVKRAIQQALNDEFAKYNPYAELIAAQQAGATPGTTQVSSTFDTMGQGALERLKGELGRQGVSAVSLTIASIAFDGKTQDNLNNLSSSIAQTQIALQNEKTAAAQAEASRLLNTTAATPETLAQLCIQATQKVLEEGHTLPDGWSCFGPSSAQVTTK